MILLTKILIFLMRLLGGGSSLPGEIALKYDKNILRKVSRFIRPCEILQSGTNEITFHKAKMTRSSLLEVSCARIQE